MISLRPISLDVGSLLTMQENLTPVCFAAFDASPHRKSISGPMINLSISDNAQNQLFADIIQRLSFAVQGASDLAIGIKDETSAVVKGVTSLTEVAFIPI